MRLSYRILQRENFTDKVRIRPGLLGEEDQVGLGGSDAGSGLLDKGAAHLVQILVTSLDEGGVLGQDDVLAGDLFGRIAEENVDAVLAGEEKLGIDVLDCAGVLGLLHYDALISSS